MVYNASYRPYSTQLPYNNLRTDISVNRDIINPLSTTPESNNINTSRTQSSDRTTTSTNTTSMFQPIADVIKDGGIGQYALNARPYVAPPVQTVTFHPIAVITQDGGIGAQGLNATPYVPIPMHNITFPPLTTINHHGPIATPITNTITSTTIIPPTDTTQSSDTQINQTSKKDQDLSPHNHDHAKDYKDLVGANAKITSDPAHLVPFPVNAQIPWSLEPWALVPGYTTSYPDDYKAIKSEREKRSQKAESKPIEKPEEPKNTEKKTETTIESAHLLLPKKTYYHQTQMLFPHSPVPLPQDTGRENHPLFSGGVYYYDSRGMIANLGSPLFTDVTGNPYYEYNHPIYGPRAAIRYQNNGPGPFITHNSLSHEQYPNVQISDDITDNDRFDHLYKPLRTSGTPFNFNQDNIYNGHLGTYLQFLNPIMMSHPGGAIASPWAQLMTPFQQSWQSHPTYQGWYDHIHRINPELFHSIGHAHDLVPIPMGIVYHQTEKKD